MHSSPVAGSTPGGPSLLLVTCLEITELPEKCLYHGHFLKATQAGRVPGFPAPAPPSPEAPQLSWSVRLVFPHAHRVPVPKGPRRS